MSGFMVPGPPLEVGKYSDLKEAAGLPLEEGANVAEKIGTDEGPGSGVFPFPMKTFPMKTPPPLAEESKR